MTPKLLLAAALAALLSPTVAAAAPAHEMHIEAELVSEHAVLAPGENWVALRLKPDAGWHTYWQNPGDSGLPTRLDWTLPAGVSAGAIHWPYPERFTLGNLAIYGYGGETLHLVPLEVPGNWPLDKPLPLHARAKWLVCADVCIPGQADLDLTLPVAAQPRTDARWSAAFANARAHLPQPMPAGWQPRFATSKTDFSLGIAGAGLNADQQIAFFPLASDLVNHDAPQRTAVQDGTLRLSQKLSAYFVTAPAQANGVLEVGEGDAIRAYAIDARPGAVSPVAQQASTTAAPAGDHSLPLVLLFALLGGLLLNLMPCVFPVLSLKALSVLNGRGHERAQQRGHSLAYTAGVVLSCVAVAALLLALRAGGAALGWGFQLQSPLFVALLAWLLFVLGLSLSGAVEFGVGIMGLGQSLTQDGGYAGSFFTGVLATVVASPCSAPFMGTALGFALTQPAVAALAIFAALGLGLALPFLLIGFVPRLASLLPRPGAWMQNFKQLMAFPLYLSAVWLLWVLAHQTSSDATALALVGMVLIAFALWLWPRRNLFAKVLLLLALLAAALLLTRPEFRAGAQATVTASAHEAWSAARVAQLRAQGRTVFVDFTADWCLTCKVNEHAVLDRASVRAAFRAHDVAYLVGDWTRQDPAITQVLTQFQRSGVPLYLLYVKGGEPRVLPQILTPDAVIAALGSP